MPDIDILLSDFEAQFVSELERVYAELTRSLEGYIQGFDIVNGQFANTPLNVQRLADAQNQMSQILADSGYNEVVDRNISKYQDIIEGIQAEYAAQGIAPAFTALDVDTLRLASQFDLSAFETIGEQGTATIAKQLFNSVSGNGSSVGFIDSIREAVPAYYKRWASTYATTASRTFGRQVEDKIQEAAGITSFEYHGPMDKNTRPFCAMLLRSGGTHTREEIAAMDNGQTPVGTVKEMGGGWNCRHRWIAGDVT